PTTESFIVHAWAHQGDFAPASAVVYIKQQETEHFDGQSIAAGAPGDAGDETWRIKPPYYWPKTHKLTFTAYSPKEMITYASIDSVTGIKLTDVVIGEVDTHRDILYSNRVYNQTYPGYKFDVANNELIGVDIQFHHALASVKVMVTALKNYEPTNAITINKIWFDNVEMKGTFTEGLVTGLEPSSTGSWTEPTETSEVDLKGGDVAIDEVAPTPTVKQYGSTALLIPQNLDGNLNVTYTITNPNGTTKIQETKVFKLSEQKDNSDIAIVKWEQSKRYTYTLTFGLNEIYLAPQVDNWDDVTMSDINI
ncbi:MAG: fimbrillin family protein, partial [Muribaculaceae bacterium]|nr:fimbrillin family protein [Muribaculaceae bacterium]